MSTGMGRIGEGSGEKKARWYAGGRWNTEPQVAVQQSPTTRTIPEAIARLAYEEYGHGQTFDRLHERGGFSLAEVVMLLADRCERLTASGSSPGGSE